MKLIEPHWKEEGIQDSAKAKNYLEQYAYSSHKDYAGSLREEGKILSKDEFPAYFLKPQDFKGYVKEWLEFSHEFK